jgi:hypothetical protein
VGRVAPAWIELHDLQFRGKQLDVLLQEVGLAVCNRKRVDRMIDRQVEAVDLGLQLRRNRAQGPEVALVEVLLLGRDEDFVEPDQGSDGKRGDRERRADGAKSKTT